MQTNMLLKTGPRLSDGRRRGSGNTGNVQLETESNQERTGDHRRATFPSSGNNRARKTPLQSRSGHQTGLNPEEQHLSHNHDSAYTAVLNLALAEEHLNTILPTGPDSGRRCSATKKAIRRELRNSGAEITRCGSEPPTSSQTEARPQLDQSTGSTSQNPEPFSNTLKASGLWPGTQAMLDQAQKDLLVSPLKANARDDVGNGTPPSSGEVPAEELLSTIHREPLKQLSQEPLPSTQVLLGNFEGFSTVKKPRTRLHTSPVVTQTATSKGTRQSFRRDPAHHSSMSLLKSTLPDESAAKTLEWTSLLDLLN